MGVTSVIRISRPEFSPLSLARAVWKHKLLATVLAVGLSICGAIAVRRLPAIYKAEALILVDSQKVPERFVASTVTDDLQDRLTTISQEILSTSRLRDIINDLNLYREERKKLVMQQLIERLRRDIDVKVEKSRAFRITYQDRNAGTAAEVVNRITKLYIDQNLKSRETQAAGTTEFIQNQLDEAKTKLDALEQSVSRYKIQHTGELPEQEHSLSGALSRLQMGLQSNQESATRAQQDKLALEGALAATESAELALKRSAGRRTVPNAVDVEGETSRVVFTRPLSKVLEAQLAELMLTYTGDHPNVQQLRARIAAARQAESTDFAEAAQNQNPGLFAKRQADFAIDPTAAAELIRVHERIATLRSQIAAADRSIAAYIEDKERIVAETASYQHRVEQLPVREQEMASLMRDYEISKSNYRSLLDKKIAAEMSGDLERRQKAERFRILDMAKAPDKPFKPNRMMLYLVTAASSLALAIAAAVAKEFRTGALLGEWELPKGTHILGNIPYMRPLRDENGLSAYMQTAKPPAATMLPCLAALLGCGLALRILVILGA